ncbi:hypothetical protein PIB30_024866 [Stylosanthes scabra]|uniref:Uncharacterized protein n=1 Tax=Stylosanthes scabra TaxID=79078 RepID=A0ABU6QAB0_9FABA|nr:hypothetical protein [Stylosanthes scabra]
MASAEARAAFAVKHRFTTHDLRMPPDSSDHHPSSILKGLESDWSPSESNSSQMLHNRSSDKLPDMKSKDSDSCDNDDPTISENNRKAELLKALCHSQTRAREAEMAAQQAYNEKEHIVSLFFRQASQLFAYKQWLHVRQLENLCLQLRNKNQQFFNLLPDVKKSYHRGAKRKTRRRGVIRNCAFAFALGLSLVVAGFFLGWTMGWMFPLYELHTHVKTFCVIRGYTTPSTLDGGRSGNLQPVCRSFRRR